MLQIIILTGDLQGTGLNIFEGFKIGPNKDADLQIANSSFKGNEFIIKCSPSGEFAIFSMNKKALIVSGGENIPRLELAPGLIFSINEIGFSIQESDKDEVTKVDSSKLNFTEAFKSIISGKSSQLPVHNLKSNASFKFVRGPWIEKKWRLPWLPFSFGKNSTLYFFIDDFIPSDADFLHFSKTESSNEFTLSSDIVNFVSLNGVPLKNSKRVSHGDLVEFGQTAFYIEFK